MCEWTRYGNHAHYGQDPAYIIFLLATPQAPAARTPLSTLLSEPSNASPLFNDDELAVLSNGVVASSYVLAQYFYSSCIPLVYSMYMSSGYSKSELSGWIITFKPWLLPRIQG